MNSIYFLKFIFYNLFSCFYKKELSCLIRDMYFELIRQEIKEDEYIEKQV